MWLFSFISMDLRVDLSDFIDLPDLILCMIFLSFLLILCRSRSALMLHLVTQGNQSNGKSMSRERCSEGRDDKSTIDFSVNQDQFSVHAQEHKERGEGKTTHSKQKTKHYAGRQWIFSFIFALYFHTREKKETALSWVVSSLSRDDDHRRKESKCCFLWFFMAHWR